MDAICLALMARPVAKLDGQAVAVTRRITLVHDALRFFAAG